MLFTVTTAILGISTAFARHVTSVFSPLNSRLIAFNENWNPLALRKQRKKADEWWVWATDEIARLHKAQRLGTKIVGHLSENEIHQHHMRMMQPDQQHLDYIRRLKEYEIRFPKSIT